MMTYRNPVRISVTRIDCEIDLPGIGWVPCTLASDDPATAATYAAAAAELADA